MLIYLFNRCEDEFNEFTDSLILALATILGKETYTPTRAYGANEASLLNGEWQRCFHEGCGFGCRSYSRFKQHME
jgi:hypothetical protein